MDECLIFEVKLECFANLTIKGISNPITFLAETSKLNGKTVVQSKFKIDRSRWDVRYGSKSFFNDLGDQAISDVITFDVFLIVK